MKLRAKAKQRHDAGRPGGLKKQAGFQQVATATRDSARLEIIGENRGLANRFEGAENENPGALAGASGAIVDTKQSTSAHYSDALGGARRIDQNGNWNRGRWAWLKAVTGDGDLSPMARLLAHVLEIGRASCRERVLMPV